MSLLSHSCKSARPQAHAATCVQVDILPACQKQLHVKRTLGQMLTAFWSHMQADRVVAWHAP